MRKKNLLPLEYFCSRSPPRTRRSSVSSTGSGVNPSLLTPSSSLLSPSPSHTSRARSTTPDPKRARSISTSRDRRSTSRHRDGESETSRDRRSVSRQRESDKIYRDTESSRQRRSVSRQRDSDSARASKPRGSDVEDRKLNGRSHSIASNEGGHSRNDYGNSRSGSLDYAASSRGNSIDYAYSRNSSLDFGNNRSYLNHSEGESYSLPYDINISGGKSRSDSCYSDNLEVSKINEEISKLNRTCNELDENAFLKRSNPCEYEAGIDSSPAPRVSDNFNRTYEQVSKFHRF